MFRTDRPDAGEQFSGAIIHSPKRRRVAGDGFLPDDGMNAKQNLKRKTSWMDSHKGVTLHSNLMGHYLRELDRQAENRMQMAMDEDFYDHIQFTDEEIETLQNRGQDPLVFNMIHTATNWVLGSQRRSPMDYRILSRNEEGVKAAERKSQLLKHVGDANHFDAETADAFSQAVKAGMGWLELGEGSDDDSSKVLMRAENWRSMLWDSAAQRYDLEDARYLMRAKWLDLDTAVGLWKHRAGMLFNSVSIPGNGMFISDDLGDDAMDHQESEHYQTYRGGSRSNSTTSRDRVRVIECWFKRLLPVAETIRGGQFHGELFDPWSIGHVNELNEGRAFLSTRPRMVVHCALFTDNGLLDVRRSPYRHNRYPFTPIWGYRRARDGMPYGLIRGIRDIQRDLNARAAKSLHHLSTTRVSVEEGAVDDIEELRDEAARPDAVIVHKQGKAAPVIDTDRAVAADHLALMSRDADMIQQVSGVTDENMGRQTNASSGKAIIARQDQGALTTSQFFDNLRRSRILHGEKSVIMVEQYYTEEYQFRITDSRGNPDFVAINNGDPENSIATFKADFIVSEEDWRASARQARAEQLLELAKQLAATSPEMVVGIMDLVVEALDVPHKDEMVKRIRMITGQEDPDADPNNPTPEEAERQAAKKAQGEIQQRQILAEVAKSEAEAQQKQADAQKTAAEAQKILADLGAAGQDGQAALAADQQAFELKQAFEAKLMELREQAVQQTARYEAQIADLANQLSKALEGVEVAKAKVEAEGKAEVAEIEARAEIAVAKIQAHYQEKTAEAADNHSKTMGTIKDKAQSLGAERP